jgi:hypothetical protein
LSEFICLFTLSLINTDVGTRPQKNQIEDDEKSRKGLLEELIYGF